MIREQDFNLEMCVCFNDSRWIVCRSINTLGSTAYYKIATDHGQNSTSSHTQWIQLIECNMKKPMKSGILLLFTLLYKF